MIKIKSYYLYKRLSQKGFSLIEMLVSLMIAGMVLAILYQMVFYGLKTIQNLKQHNNLKSSVQSTFIRLENIFGKLTTIQEISTSNLLVFSINEDMYRLELNPINNGYGLFLQKNNQNPMLLLYPVKDNSLNLRYFNQEGTTVNTLNETSFLEISLITGYTFSLPIDSGFYLENKTQALTVYPVE